MKEKEKIQNTQSRWKNKITFVFLILCVSVFIFWVLMWEPKPDTASEAIIRKAAAQQLHKEPNDLTDEDFAKITNLYIQGDFLKNIKLLEKFINLQELRINGYPFPENEIPKWMAILAKLKLYNPSIRNTIDLNPLKNLQNLQKLNLEAIQVSDIKPLRGLRNLQELSISGSKVTDLGPLKKLMNLQKLEVSGSEVSNLEPIKRFTKLQVLALKCTEVSNLAPIKELKNLQRIDLSGSRVSDLEPIKGLANLKNLELFDTRISDLEPIKGLTNLEILDLNYTSVSSIEPLKSLVNLKSIDICRSTNITYEQQQELQKCLPNLHFAFYYGGGPYTPRN
jgi:Leucine-rich repeat (LRR) protein